MNVSNATTGHTLDAVKKTPKTPKPQEILQGPIGPTLARLTLPVLMGIIALISFNIVDTYFIGLLGTAELAAVSFTFPVAFTVVSLSIGLGIGTSAVVARAKGAGNLKVVKRLTTDIFFLVFIVALVMTVIGLLTIDPIFRLLGASDDLMPIIHDYMDIYYFSMLFLFVPMNFNSALRAIGDTLTPGVVMSGSAVLNAILDPILIFGLGPIPAMGVQGAALATLMTWAISAIILSYIVVVKKRLFSKARLKLSVMMQSWQQALTIGLPAAGANMLTPIAGATITALVASFGDQAVAAFGVGTRLESMAVLVVLALSMSLPPFISQNFGAGQLARVQEVYKKVTGFVLVWQLLIATILFILAKPIATLFSNDPQVIELIQYIIWVLPISYGCQGIIILTASSFNALHKPMPAVAVSVVRLFVFYVPLAYLGAYWSGLPGLFIGVALANVLTSIFAYWFMTKLLKQLAAPLAP